MISLGLLGGTFDPIHHGHLHLAQAAREQLALTHMLLIPAGHPWQRAPQASPEQRLTMAQLAVSEHPQLEVDEREVKRSGPTYTVDTLSELRQHWGADAKLWLILGADAMANLHTWHQWRRLFDYAHVAVANRPGHGWHPEQIEEPMVRDFLLPRFAKVSAVQGTHGALCSLEITPMEISSTQIREAIRQGEDISALVPAPVADYIHQQKLYCSQENP
jgi:nicotinate-nucleotide adenylyltransferase